MSDGELERLRAECQALDQQLKLLVKTEHRLYVSRGERDTQVRRIRALAGFALGSKSNEPPEGILVRAMDVLSEVFAVDAAAVLRFEAGAPGLVTLSTGAAGAELPLSPELLAWIQAQGTSILDIGPSPPPELVELVDAVAGRGKAERGGLVALAPIIAGEGALKVVLVAMNEPRRAAAYRLDHLGQSELPIWQLLAMHVERALENALLTDGLRLRTEELARTNAELLASVENLERTRAALIQAQKMEAIGQLAGGVAHDFNNLLTVIMSHTSLLADEITDETMREDLEAIVSAARRAAGITRQLLVFGRRQPQRRSIVDLNDVTAAMARMLSRLIGEQIALSVHLYAGGATIDADPVQVEQVLLNLVVNARDAMPDGGTVEISTRPATAEDLARVGAEAEPSAFFALTVKDTGVGMDEATQAKIFEPFFTTKEVGKGTGLGLAVVYGAVSQTGGHVYVRSAPGEGASFVVLLPAPQTTEAKPSDAQPGAQAQSAATRHILLVEDEDDIRRVASRILLGAGFRVTEASDGEEALDIARRERFDLLLSDMVMPKIGGVRLAAELGPLNPSMRVLFMSGYSVELGAGMDCIQKPFEPSALIERVQAALG